MKRALLAPLALLLASCATLPPAQQYDLVIRNGTIVDGSGGAAYVGDVAVRGDRIVAVGPRLAGGSARTIDATGLTVSPGFVNMLSWATESLIEDGAGESDIRQGVTLEVMGEGNSMGPYTEGMARLEKERQGDIKYDIDWRTLGQYFAKMEKRGIAPNIASFVGATTVRVHALGEGDVDPSPAQLAAMQNTVRFAMDEGAMGVGSSLIYAPAFYAETPELIALATASAQCGGMYISHMRNESDNLLEAVDELIAIARASGGPAEIYHLKQAGKDNWNKLDAVIAKVEAARASGIRITADMYTYVAGATGLDAAMPPWVQAGGYEEWKKRLQDPAIRAKVLKEMRARPVGWDNLYYQAGSADKLILIGFKNEKLKPLTGKTLAEVATMRGTSPEDTAIDLVIEDNIALFDDAPDIEKIAAAAYSAALHDEIQSMTMAYESLVGDMGSSLSGGQRQRLLIARALYRQPKLLVIDEGTSEVDVAREHTINSMMAAISVSRIVVAHRLDTIAAASRAYSLRDGILSSVNDLEAIASRVPSPVRNSTKGEPK